MGLVRPSRPRLLRNVIEETNKRARLTLALKSKLFSALLSNDENEKLKAMEFLEHHKEELGLVSFFCYMFVCLVGTLLLNIHPLPG